MMRPLFIWLSFVFCLAVVSLAMGSISHTVFRLESAEIQAARQSENERLALWRMDSALMPLITRESARPAYEYQPFYQPDNLYTRMFSPIDASRLQSRSSLITLDTKLCRLHFQFEADGSLSSPQVPIQSWRDFAEAQNFTTFECIEAYSRELDRLKRTVTWDDLDQSLPQEVETEPDAIPEDFQVADVQPNAATDFQVDDLPMQGAYLPQQFAEPLQQKRYQENTRSMKEFERRKGAAQKNQVRSNSFSQQGNPQQPVPQAGNPVDDNAEIAPQPGGKGTGQSRHGPMHAIWHGESLLLVRRVMVDGHQSIQGCVLDWPEIRQRLLLDITDLLPDARLVPVPKTPTANRTLFLATLPVWLSPGKAPLEVIPSLTPLRLSLLIAWGGVFLAATAVAVLLMCVVRLSERRGAFVSAVTHELRTPLTTFRLYTEMLADGIVPTEEKRQSYLQTLRVEADRLGHLVENVLSYARLENGRSRLVKDEIYLGELLQRLEHPLRERTERSGMTLDLDIAEDDPLCVQGDGGAIERIVFNLVDNACKYATESEDRNIHLVCRRDGNQVVLEVRDHGKGIAQKSARRLFRPFSKSATEAAHSAPGVGLGLALCRRLAKSLGGRLIINHNVDDGACIVLTLPLCKQQDA
ncbi:MAG: HAMP domain-containing histidine kinase [Planctomycetaceae bacterium]|nr:HAMP domain-containing histidine kinase [Planctomycetaceae bacterium]